MFSRIFYIFLPNVFIRTVGIDEVERVCEPILECRKDTDCDIGIGEKVRYFTC